MKSKISFFNKTIFLKNVTLYWPIWGMYSIAVFIALPGILWAVNHMGNFYSPYEKTQRFSDLLVCLAIEPMVLIIAFAAVITGMALYSYLYNSKSANMIHSLPVDRTQLYGTTLISGWAFLIVPIFVSAILASVVCLCYGVPGILYVWVWCLVSAATAFIAFGIVTICALFTGHTAMLPVYVFFVNFASWIIYYLIYCVVTTFAYGVNSLSDSATRLAETLSPIQCFMANLQWNSKVWTIEAQSDMADVFTATLQGTEYVWFYLILAVVCYVVAFLLYRKRKIEQSGDFLTVNWVKPIFRALIGCVGGIYGAMLIRALLLELHFGCPLVVFVPIMLMVGMIFYFAADMFIKKSFRVFKKRDWRNAGIFAVVLVVIFFGLYGMADRYEKYIPQREEVTSAELVIGYDITLEGEEIAIVLDIHDEILENIDALETIDANGNDDYYSLKITYFFADKEFAYRRYKIPAYMEEMKAIIDKITELEKNSENFLEYQFGENYQDITTFYDARLEARFINPEYRGDEDAIYQNGIYESVSLEPEHIKELYDAVVADAKAGTLMKYNVYSGSLILEKEYGNSYYKSSEVNISFEYVAPATEETYDSGYYDDTFGVVVYDEASTRGAYISIGPDCENTINKLIELGVIESVEHLWWGELEEMLD